MTGRALQIEWLYKGHVKRVTTTKHMDTHIGRLELHHELTTEEHHHAPNRWDDYRIVTKP